MTRDRRFVAWLLLVAALLLTVLGQRYFYFRRDYLWDGLVLHLLGAACFVAAWHASRSTGRPAAGPARRRWGLALGGWLSEWPIPGALLLVALFLALAAGLLARDRVLEQTSSDVVLLWGLGTALVAAAALVQAGPRRLRLRGWDRSRWSEVAALLALTAAAVALRLVALSQVPYTVGGDEAWHGLLARQVLHGELRNPFAMGYMSMPTFFYWPVSWSLWLAGDDLLGLRLPAALAGAATVPALYLFARELWGRPTALLAAAFLATYDYHIHYSRLGANNVWDALFVLLALWALDRGLRGQRQDASSEQQAAGRGSNRWRWFVVAGIIMGLSAYFYTGARLLPVLTVAYAGYVWLQRRGKVERLGLHLALLALAFLVTAAPMLSYALAHPGEWNARINQVGILQSGWLEREPELTGKSTAAILAEQFLRSAGAFHVFRDRTVWYGSELPLLNFGAGALMVLGLAWAVAHWRERRHLLLLLWFWSVIITGGMLTESPPSSQRLVIAIPAVALLVALGLQKAVRLAWRVLVLPRRAEAVLLVLAMMALGAANVRYYFVEFSPQRMYGSENGETATMMGHYLRELEPGTTVYLFAAPRLYWSFGTMSFLAPHVAGQDVLEPLTAPPALAPGARAAFLFLPERAPELAWVQQALPGGRVTDFYDPLGRLRFMAYETRGGP